MASRGLLLYRQRNGALVVTQEASQKSVAMLIRGLGRPPEGILSSCTLPLEPGRSNFLTTGYQRISRS